MRLDLGVLSFFNKKNSSTTFTIFTIYFAKRRIGWEIGKYDSDVEVYTILSVNYYANRPYRSPRWFRRSQKLNMHYSVICFNKVLLRL